MAPQAYMLTALLFLGVAGIILLYVIVLLSRVSASRPISPVARLAAWLRRVFSRNRAKVSGVAPPLEREMTQAVLNSSPCAFLLLDANGIVVRRFNVASVFPNLMLPENTNALNLLREISEDAIDFAAALRRAAAGGKSSYTILASEKFLARENQDRYLHLAFSPARVRAAAACVVRIDDITEVKDLEVRSEESREFLRNIILQAPTSMCVFNAEGAAILANQAHLRLFRSTDEQYIGRYNIFRDKSYRSEGLFPEIQRAFHGQVVNIPSMIFRFPSASGEEKIEVRGILFPLLNAQDEATNVVMMLQDMTEQRKAEGEARYLEEYNRRILGSMGAAVRVIDADLNIEYANDYMKNNLDRAPGKPCHDFLERAAPCEPCLVRQAISGGGIVSGEFCTPSERWFSYVAAPIKKPDGKVSAVGVIRDVTETKRLQQQMIQQEKMSAIGLLASGIAHEINNPLGVISTFAQMLGEKAGDPRELKQCAEVINRNVDNCRRVVQSLLGFSRVEPEKLGPVDLNDCVRDAFLLTGAAMRKAGIELVQKLDERPLVFDGDRVQMQQVMINLIINAVQAMPSGGTLGVSTGRELLPSGAGMLYARVADTGCGMSPEVAARALEPFFSTKKAERGTGLGLSLCKSIIEKHGGKIAFKTEEGKGAIFTVTLPEPVRQAAEAAL
jgi:PAS domain S-box-containing protein